MLGLQGLQLAHQRVVFGVGDLRMVENVILVFVMAKFLAELLDFRIAGSFISLSSII